MPTFVQNQAGTLQGFPAWAPPWLRKMVEEPDCTGGTHPFLRRLAKWLLVYIPPDECPGVAAYWLGVAAQKCDRVASQAELDRLLTWAAARVGVEPEDTDAGALSSYRCKPDLHRIYNIIVNGPTLKEFRDLYPTGLTGHPAQNSAEVLRAWQRYSGIDNPLVCHGSKSNFFTSGLERFIDRASIFEQVVPSPMASRYGRTLAGHLSQHSLEATGPRQHLVVEFDFSPVTRQRKPSIWAPLISDCALRGYTVLDMNAALVAHLRDLGPLWLCVYSGGKSLQPWFACKDVDEPVLWDWFNNEALAIGACHSTWCRSQFVRMPGGQRDDGKRQTIEFFNPAILEVLAAKGHPS